MSNKLLILSIALVMVCSLHALIFADGVMPSGLGTAANPFQVATLDNLLWVQTNEIFWDKCFIQTADIDANYTGSPIGNSATEFTGTYNGQGYIISNFSSSSSTSQGLFGYIGGGAIIENVGMVDCTITGVAWIGGLIGIQSGGSVNNCYATGEVSGNIQVGGLIGIQSGGSVNNCYATGSVSGTNNVGGLIGGQVGGGSDVRNCYATGPVSGENQCAGGLIGWQVDATASECYATGEVTGEYYVGGLIGLQDDDAQTFKCHATGEVTGTGSVGGLIGSLTSSVTDCYATGPVSGEDGVSGLIGISFGTVANCYATGEVSGNIQVGGLIGASFGTAANCYATAEVSGETYVGGLIGYDYCGTVTNSYATGEVSGISSAGGLVGYDYSGTFTSSYWDTQTSGQSTSAGGTGKTTQEMKTQSTYVGWDFTTTWIIRTYYNDGYPDLKFFVPVDPGVESFFKEMHVLNYPNPVQNRTTISYSIKGIGNNETVDVRIFNLKGQLVERTEATGGSLELNTQYYTPGIYFYKVAHEKKTLTGKMMIVK